MSKGLYKPTTDCLRAFKTHLIVVHVCLGLLLTCRVDPRQVTIYTFIAVETQTQKIYVLLYIHISNIVSPY